MVVGRFLRGVTTPWPRRAILGVFLVLAVLRALGKQAVRVGPFVPDIGPGWVLALGAAALFLRPPSAFRIGRDRLFWMTLALGVSFVSLGAWLLETSVEPPSKTVVVLHRLETGALEERRGSTESLQIPSRRHLNRMAGRRRVEAVEITGHLFVPQGGPHGFEAFCDGSCSLRIDNQTLVSGGGWGGVVELEQGVHRFSLRYERRNGRALLRLTWDRPGFVELVPLDYYVSEDVGLLMAELRREKELVNALWVVQGTMSWLFVLCLALWAGEKTRGHFLLGRDADAARSAGETRPSLLTYLGFGLAFAAHGLFVLELIGAGPLLGGSALVQDDYSYHLASAVRVRGIFLTSHRLWGYSPALMAGFPAGTLDSATNRVAESAVALLFWLPEDQVFAFLMVGLYCLPPLLAYATSRSFGLTNRSSMVAAVLAILLFYTYLEGRSAYVRWGMYSYAVATVFAPCVAAVFLRLFRAGGWTRSAMAGLLLGLGVSLHLLFPLMTLPAIFASALTMSRGDRAWMRLACAAVFLAALVNLHWVTPFWMFRDSIGQASILGHFPGTPSFLLVRLGFWKFALPHLVWVLGLMGLPRFARNHGSAAAAACAAGAGTMLALGVSGSFLPVLELVEPGRFLDAVAFFLAPPAVVLFERAFATRRVLLSGALLCLALVAYPSLRSWARVVGDESGGSLVTWSEEGRQGSVSTDVVRLVQRLREVTTKHARVMLEDADHLGRNQHGYDYTHLPALFPHLVDREFIGGPMDDSRLVHHFADFTSGRVFSRDLEGLGDGELRAYLELYNVGWIVAWSSVSRRNLGGRPFLRRLETIGTYELFAVDAVHSFGIEQEGIRVQADADRIRVQGAAPGTTVLKYHCMEGWRSEPPLRVHCVTALDDPVGFIAVDNGRTTDFTLMFR